MRFTRLKLTHWRNFDSLRLSLGPRALFFGPNASGKSNLLDALRFVSEIALPDGGLGRAVARRGGRFLRSQHAPPGTDFKIEIEAELDDEAWAYGVAVSLDKAGLPRVRSETVAQGRRRLLRRPEADDRREPLRLTQTHLEQASTSAAFQPLLEFLRSVRSFRGPVAPGELLRSALALQKRPREARLRRCLELARAVLPRLERLTVEHDEAGVPQMMARLDRGKAATWFPTDQLSASTARLLALLWEATHGDGPLLLEEPEQGLHPEATGRLLELLASAAPKGGRQLLVSTHAERLLDDARVSPAEIFLLNPTSEGTHIEVASDDTQIRATATAEEPLGPIVAARTSPDRAGQMPLFFGPQG